MKRMIYGNDPARFDSYVNFDGPVSDALGSSCWLWTGTTSSGGYGRFPVGGRKAKRLVAAHRWNYERHVELVPPELQLDHLCRVRNCVRPSHLEPVTPRVNQLRGTGPAALKAAQVMCGAGLHPLAGDNLVPYYLARGSRRCRQCATQRQREYRARQAGVV